MMNTHIIYHCFIISTPRNDTCFFMNSAMCMYAFYSYITPRYHAFYTKMVNTFIILTVRRFITTICITPYFFRVSDTSFKSFFGSVITSRFNASGFIMKITPIIFSDFILTMVFYTRGEITIHPTSLNAFINYFITHKFDSISLFRMERTPFSVSYFFITSIFITNTNTTVSEAFIKPFS